MSADGSIVDPGQLNPVLVKRSVWPDWMALFGLALVGELFARFLPAGVLRAIVALPPLLVLPGFALLSLLLGKSRPRELAMTGVFSIALSFAVLMLDALLLNAAGVRLSLSSLGFGALAASGVLFALNASLGRPVLESGLVERLHTTLVRPGVLMRCVALALSLVVGVGVVAVVARRLPAPASAPFATLSLAPSWAGKSSPPQVAAGRTVSIPVVATTDGTVAGQHQLTTSVDGKVVSSRSVYLSKDGTWRGQVNVVAPSGSSLHRVVVSMAFGSSSASDEQVVVYLSDDAS